MPPQHTPSAYVAFTRMKGPQALSSMTSWLNTPHFHYGHCLLRLKSALHISNTQLQMDQDLRLVELRFLSVSHAHVRSGTAEALPT